MKAAVLLLVLLLLCACEEPDSPAAVAPAPQPVAADERGITYRATSVMITASPVQFRTTFIAVNAAQQAIELQVASHCMVQLRVWDNPRYEGRPIWDQADSDGACTTLHRTILLAPGETRVFEGDARPRLAAGRYFLSARLRRAGRVIEVATGNAEITTP
jgi:hypothetical protein